MKPILLALAAATLTGAATPPTRLSPGEWQIENVPVGASLDGRALGDLPYTPGAPQRVCLSAADAVDPARWFLRDSGKGCTIAERSIAGGRVAIAATCPGQAAGDAPGTVHLTGTWAPGRYDLRFATTTVGENGTMGFTGTITGRRLGACPG